MLKTLSVSSSINGTRKAMLASALVFILGAILGLFYDGIHVLYGVLHYEKPHFLGTSFWVLLEFGGASVVSLWVMLYLQRYVSFPKATPSRILYDGVLLFLAYLVTGICLGRNDLTLLGLLLIAVAVLAVPREKLELVGCVIFPIIGPFCEYTFSKAGLFHYTNSESVPYWLPLLWLIASGVFVNSLSLIVKKIRL